jgi:hypothetical protein
MAVWGNRRVTAMFTHRPIRPLHPLRNQMTPIHTLTPRFCNIYGKIHASCMVYTIQYSQPYSVHTFLSLQCLLRVSSISFSFTSCLRNQNIVCKLYNIRDVYTNYVHLCEYWKFIRYFWISLLISYVLFKYSFINRLTTNNIIYDIFSITMLPLDIKNVLIFY